MKNITAELKTWLQSKGIEVDLESAVLTHEEGEHLYGILTHTYGVAPEQVKNVAYFPDILPSALLDEILGLEPAVITPAAPVAPLPAGSTSTDGGNADTGEGSGEGEGTDTGTGDNTPQPPEATGSAPEAPQPETQEPPAPEAPAAPESQEPPTPEVPNEQAPEGSTEGDADPEVTAPEAGNETVSDETKPNIFKAAE